MIKELNGLRILFATDLHYHTHGADDDEIGVNQYGYTGDERLSLFVSDVLAEHRRSPLDACIILGDMAGNNYSIRPYVERDEIEAYYGSEDDMLYAVKTRYLDKIEEAGIPVYCLPGNHDAYPPHLWKRLFGYEREYLIEFPERDTAILMLDLYGFPLDNPFFTKNRETVAPRSFRSDAETEALLALLARAKAYKHLLACGHWVDGTAAPYLREMENLDAYFVGDAHCVASLGVTAAGVPTYILGKYSYSINEELKVQNGYGTPHVYKNGNGEYVAPWTVDTRLPLYRDFGFFPATEEEIANREIPKISIAPVSEVGEYYRWNYAVYETDVAGDKAKLTAVFPERTYYGISRTTGHLLRFHGGMFPSIAENFHSPYEERELFSSEKAEKE